MSPSGLFRAEMYRRTRRWPGWMVLAMPALAGAARILGGSLLAECHRAQILAAGAAGGMGGTGAAAAAAQGTQGFGVLADGLQTGGAVLVVVVLLAGALADVRDRETGALAMLHLAAPRVLALGAKAAFLVAAAIVGLLVLTLVCAACAAVTQGLGPVVEEGYTMASAQELAGQTARALAASIPPLVAAGMFGLFVSTAASTAGGAAGAALVPLVLLGVAGGILGAAEPYLFVTYVPFLGGSSALGRLPDIARAYSDAVWGERELGWGGVVCGVEACVMFAMAVLVSRGRPAA